DARSRHEHVRDRSAPLRDAERGALSHLVRSAQARRAEPGRAAPGLPAGSSLTLRRILRLALLRVVAAALAGSGGQARSEFHADGIRTSTPATWPLARVDAEGAWKVT